MRKKSIIIARYNENLEWVYQIPSEYKIKIYNKGGDIPFDSEKLPNVGRESHSYLKYIIDNYDNMEDEIIFTQGNPFDHCGVDFLEKINKDYPTSYFNFSNLYFDVEDLNHPPHMSFHDLSPADIYNKYINKPISNLKYKLYVNACFKVEKENVLRHSIGMYKELYERHFSDMYMPYIMEYSWHLLFDDVFYQ